MKSLFDADTFTEVKERIEKLSKDTQPQWGSMSVGQMLKHCQLPFKVADGSMALKSKPNFFKKLLFKMYKKHMYNDTPWKKNLPTPSDFKITSEHEFETEKNELLKQINHFVSLKDNNNWPTHPFFGKFTTEQWGKMQYKHLNHHLTQFGV